MTSTRLQNYLCSGRKRLALSQDEVAFLMGRRGGAKISKYESFTQLPGLEAALALEVIYGTPVHELFVGLRDQLVQDISARAKILRHRVRYQKPDRRSQRKRAAITSLIAPAANPQTS